MNKAQVISAEYMIAFFLFFAATVVIMSLWNQVTADAIETETDTRLESIADDAAETLLRTQGLPTNWSRDNVTSIGLANVSRQILRYKVEEFIELLNDTQTDLCDYSGTNYECNKHMVGVSGYDFYINFSDINGTTLTLDNGRALAGRLPVNETKSITITRTGLLDDEVVKATLTIWK